MSLPIASFPERMHVRSKRLVHTLLIPALALASLAACSSETDPTTPRVARAPATQGPHSTAPQSSGDSSAAPDASAPSAPAPKGRAQAELDRESGMLVAPPPVESGSDMTVVPPPAGTGSDMIEAPPVVEPQAHERGNLPRH